MFTDDDALAQAFREIRHHGQAGRYHHTRVGINGRLDTIQCAILLAKLERFDWEVEQRQVVARRYEAMLAGLAPARPDAPGPVRPDERLRAVHRALRGPRARGAEAESAPAIPTAVHYPVSLHQQPAYAAALSGRVASRCRKRSRARCSACRCIPTSTSPRSGGSSTRCGRGQRAALLIAISFAYLTKLFWHPIRMCTSPATPSRKPSRKT